MIKFLHSLYTFQCSFLITSRMSYSHHIYSIPYKSRKTIFINISRPARPDCCKTCTMCYIKHSSHFMLQRMTYKITAVISTTCKTIMRKTSCPHNLCTCFIVHRIIMQYFCILHYCTQKAFSYLICQFHIAAISKITFHSMHHNIRTTRFSLVIRQAHCQLRIHNCKFRT